MSRSGFYTDNELRSYPFITGESIVHLPTHVVVDFGCTMSLEAEFENGVHSVWLHQVLKVDQSYKFEFKTNAPGLAGRSLVFEFFEDDPEFATRFSSDDLALGSSAAWESDTPLGSVWEGYLVIGILGYANYAMLPAGTLLWKAPPQEAMLWKAGSFLMEQIYPESTGISNFGSTSYIGDVIEPTLIQSLSGVVGINLVNKPRLHVTPFDGDSLPSYGEPLSTVINSIDLVGGINICPGYNAVVNISAADNSITFSAELGSGEGEPCSEVPLNPLGGSSEVPPEGSQLLSGGPRCKDTIKTINGISGKSVTIKGGAGVTVTSDGDTIFITADLHGMTLCNNFLTSSVGG